MQPISSFIAGFINSLSGKTSNSTNSNIVAAEVSFASVMNGLAGKSVNSFVIGNADSSQLTFRKREEEVKAPKKEPDKYTTVYDLISEIERYDWKRK